MATSRLLDPSGRPFEFNGKATELKNTGFALHQVSTFSGIVGSVSKSYRWAFDEALRNSPANALAMRRDGTVMALLRERQMPTANSKWHLEPEDPKDPHQQEIAEALTDIVKAIPRFSKFRLQLLEALWFGRYGNQMAIGKRVINGQTRYAVYNHQPVHGDKFIYRWDGTPGVLISQLYSQRYQEQGLLGVTEPYVHRLREQGGVVLPTDRGLALFLETPQWRERFAIHMHESEDADFTEPELAGGIYGVGLRHRAYWLWWLRNEVLSSLLDYLARVGAGGLTLIGYEAGNEASKQEALDIGEQLEAGNIILVPKPVGTEKLTATVDRLEPSQAGSEFLIKIVNEFFDDWMERLFVGQTMSGGSDGQGSLGGTGRANFAAQTKDQLVQMDADALDETLTEQVVQPMKRWNFPMEDFKVFFKTDLAQPNPKEVLEAAKTIVDMGGEVVEQEILEIAGLSTPEPGDKTLGGGQSQLGGGPTPGGAPGESGPQQDDPQAHSMFHDALDSGELFTHEGLGKMKSQLADQGMVKKYARDSRDQLKGGLADDWPTVDKDSLEEGINVEMEHTDDRAVAEEIARDHLAEDPHYYVKLRSIESKKYARVQFDESKHPRDKGKFASKPGAKGGRFEDKAEEKRYQDTVRNTRNEQRYQQTVRNTNRSRATAYGGAAGHPPGQSSVQNGPQQGQNNTQKLQPPKSAEQAVHNITQLASGKAFVEPQTLGELVDFLISLPRMVLDSIRQQVEQVKQEIGSWPGRATRGVTDWADRMEARNDIAKAHGDGSLYTKQGLMQLRQKWGQRNQAKYQQRHPGQIPTGQLVRNNRTGELVYQYERLWDESKVNRGDAENAGHFATKPGGSSETEQAFRSYYDKPPKANKAHKKNWIPSTPNEQENADYAQLTTSFDPLPVTPIERFFAVVKSWIGRTGVEAWDIIELGNEAEDEHYKQLFAQAAKIIAEARQELKNLMGEVTKYSRSPQDGQARILEIVERMRDRLLAIGYKRGVLKYGIHHAPKGGTVIEGKPFLGGQFTPGIGAANYVPSDEAVYKHLKSEWSRVNNEMLTYIDHPQSPEALAGLAEMKDITKQMHRLHADKGDWSGLSRPGGPRDIVVIGGGPGGLASAIMGATDGLDTLLVEAMPRTGGQSKYSSRIENFPGFPLGVTGDQLSKTMYEQAERLGSEIQTGVRVTGLSVDPSGMKTLTLSNGQEVKARSVIIAGGLEFRKLAFPGSESENVVYGDAEELKKRCANSPVVIIGGSNGAAQAALGVSGAASHVYILSRGKIADSMSDYQVEAVHTHPKITVIEGDSVKSFEKDVLETNKGLKLPAKAIGIFIGSAPNLGWLPKDIAIQEGKVHVDENMETSIPGIFAVGDIRHGSIGRIGAAVGDGQMAEHGVTSYFTREQAKEPKAP